MIYLGIEIGGTKLQLGAGAADGTLLTLWRRAIDPAKGAEGIRSLIMEGVGALRADLGPARPIAAAGIGFGGPVDAEAQRVIRSHQIEGWDGFALRDWIAELAGVPAIMGNDADVAGLGEALHGAGRGLSPVFYMTIGSGIGGGLIVDGRIYGGAGRGASEVGHLAVTQCDDGAWKTQKLEAWASGWGIQEYVREKLAGGAASPLSHVQRVTGQEIAKAAAGGDVLARAALDRATSALTQAICHVIALVCPRRIIIGGGVSLMGEALFFEPLREKVRRSVFEPFRGLTEIVPAALGEEVVIHGALALARGAFGGR